MKSIYKYMMLVGLMVGFVTGMTGCQKADEEFIHDNNLLSDVRVKTIPTNEGRAGVITEYDAQGNVVPAELVTLEAVKGGYGKVEFILPQRLKGMFDMTHCYLGASLTFDEIVTPGLAGIKDIENRDEIGRAQGIWVTVTSGTKETRRYNIIGYYEGEYILTDEE